MPWSVYIIQCRQGQLYTGITTHVQKRFTEHHSQSPKCAKYLRGKHPLALAFQMPIGEKSLALKIERKIKSLPRHAKQNIIAHVNTLEALRLATNT